MRPALRLSSLTRHLVDPKLITRNITHKMSTSTSTPSLPPAIIAGVGPGTGASVARKFALKYPVFLLARNPSNYEPLVTEITKNGGWAQGISTDVSDAGSVEKAFAEIRKFGGKGEGEGKVSAAVFNVGGRFIRKPFLELGLEEFEAGFEANGCVPFPPPPLSFVKVGCINTMQPRRLPLLPRRPAPPARRHLLSRASPHPDLHGRNGLHEGKRAVLEFRDGEVCDARAGAEFGKGVWAEGSACCACGCGWGD